MRIILSPAKKMKENTDDLDCLNLPAFLNKTGFLLEWLKGKSYDDLKSLWNCSDSIVKQNVERLSKMNLSQVETLTPAILSYEGLAFQYMAPTVFDEKQLLYIQEHLRILSGFYGVLKPMDGVTPYRLEMGSKCKVGSFANLYEFWGDSLYQEIKDESGIIVNLASKEYSKCIENYISNEERFITISFVEESNGKLVTKGTYAKMARGEMVRYMAENNICDIKEIKSFNRLGYVYKEAVSSETEFVFERTN